MISGIGIGISALLLIGSIVLYSLNDYETEAFAVTISALSLLFVSLLFSMVFGNKGGDKKKKKKKTIDSYEEMEAPLYL